MLISKMALASAWLFPNRIEACRMDRKTILIVEDDAIISMRLQEMLNAWEYHTLIASTGEIALEKVGDLHPDLILMDIRLDDKMDGIQVAEQIHARSGPPTIFITAYSDEALLTRAKLTEPYGYLVKPVQEKELRSTVEMVLFKHSMDQKLRESEAKFRTLAESTSTAILIYQGDKWVYANPAAEEMTGFSSADLLNMHYWEIAHPEHRSLVQQWEAARMAGEDVPRRYSFQIITKQGDERWWDVSSERMIFQNLPAGVLTANDITERKFVERALSESREELQALARHLQTIREEERTHIAHEIHDEFGQALTGIQMELMWMIDETQSPDLSTKLTSVMKLTDSAIERVRQIAFDLRPGLLDDLGLLAALEWQTNEFSERTHIQCRLNLAVEAIEDKLDISTTLFRIYQEALTNVARHAGATLVSASLVQENDLFVLTVADDGCGIVSEEITNRRSMGLLGMRERARSLGGDLLIRGQPGAGTTIEARIPIDTYPGLSDRSFQAEK
jgi:PAS domain S-box-containing protein